LKYRTSLIEAPRNSIAATIFLESEGINVETTYKGFEYFLTKEKLLMKK
jgi:hypothetical protein